MKRWELKTMWRRWLLSSLLLGFCAGAQAETLFYTTSLVTGLNVNVANLELDSPGTLTVKLADLDFPDLLQTLSFALSDGTQNLLQQSGSGSWTYNVTTPGTLFATFYAEPVAGAQGGLYFAHISYDVAPVPLPAAGWLLLSGLAGLGALRTKQKVSQKSA